MKAAYDEKQQIIETQMTHSLRDLDVAEVSLVGKAANRRRFLILKADSEPREEAMSYEAIESLARELITKSGERMTMPRAIARLMEQRPDLYSGQTVNVEEAPEESSKAAKTAAVFKAAYDVSGEDDFQTFAAELFDENPELGAAWYHSSLDNSV